MCLKSEADQAQDTAEGPGAWGDAALGVCGVGSRLRGIAHCPPERGLLWAPSKLD